MLQLLSQRAATAEAQAPKAGALQPEMPPQRELTHKEEEPCSPQLESLNRKQMKTHCSQK